VANGLGFLPVQMVVEEGSFLKVAVDREGARPARQSCVKFFSPTASACLEFSVQY